MAESVEVDLECEYLELPEDEEESLIRYFFFRLRVGTDPFVFKEKP